MAELLRRDMRFVCPSQSLLLSVTAIPEVHGHLPSTIPFLYINFFNGDFSFSPGKAAPTSCPILHSPTFGQQLTSIVAGDYTVQTKHSISHPFHTLVTKEAHVKVCWRDF